MRTQVDVSVLGNRHQHAPAHAWIRVVPPRLGAAAGGQGRAGVDAAEALEWHRAHMGTIMSRLLELEEEATFLRRRLDAYEDRISESVQWHTRERKHLVFELGANDGSWIADFLERHPYFEPHIFEPQPRFAALLTSIAEKFKGRHNRKAVWITDGERRTFHSHTDEGGVGSSLFGGHAYGKCGSKVCEQDFSESYEVETLDFAAYMKRVARPHDVIILRMDIEGAEYQVARHMLTTGVACWVDYWEFEGHAMYSPETVRYRPVDAVLPWLLAACGVQTVVQDWYTEDFKVWSSWNVSDNKDCPLPVIQD
jgi:FkbM family methyltransferase